MRLNLGSSENKMACLLLILLSSLVLSIHSGKIQELKENVYLVISNWVEGKTLPVKLTLTCNVSEKEAPSVYWTKNNKLQKNGKYLQITVKEPLDAGNYICEHRDTRELLTNATVFFMKRQDNGEIADPVLKPLHTGSKIYFECVANNYSGSFTCFWNSDIQDTDLKFEIQGKFSLKQKGNASQDIICEAPVNDSPGKYLVSCRKQNTTCPSTEEYQPIEMTLEVLNGFIYENYMQIFFIKDILKPDTSECYVNEGGLLTWNPPRTWNTPISYYGLKYQIKVIGNNEQICEVPNDVVIQHGTILSCYNRGFSGKMVLIRSKDHYNINSAWSKWSECRVHGNGTSISSFLIANELNAHASICCNSLPG